MNQNLHCVKSNNISHGEFSKFLWGISTLIFKVTGQVCMPTRNGCVFHALSILVSVSYTCFIDLTGVSQNPKVVLICMFLMTKDVKYFFDSHYLSLKLPGIHIILIKNAKCENAQATRNQVPFQTPFVNHRPCVCLCGLKFVGYIHKIYYI